MSSYFIETKEPIFVSFNSSIENTGTDIDFDLLINKIEENLETLKQENWQKFWHQQGEAEVLRQWNKKYKNFLKEQEPSTEIANEGNKLEEINNSEANEDISYDKYWADLWQQHRQQIHCEQYSIFTAKFYNCLFELIRFYESAHLLLEEEEEEDTQFGESSVLAQELEQLEILGLPTAFGGRPQNSGKKHKEPAIKYSDFFSDSEMENESNESDVGDKEIDNFLHKVQPASSGRVHKVKRNRKLKNVPTFILEDKGLLKYWRKRFTLFSRFDEGIRLDRESWFSVTPEKVAKHLAERLKCSVIVDGFCGSGGNIIQFAFTCDKVIAIDIDAAKLEMAKHNAEIYKVSHKIEFILGDFLQVAAGGKLKADVVFCSPPWGGPKYKNKKQYDIEKYLLPVKASELVKAARNVSKNVALFLPRNSNIKQIVKLAGIGQRCEIEHNYLDTRLVGLTALYGEEILTKEQTN